MAENTVENGVPKIFDSDALPEDTPLASKTVLANRQDWWFPFRDVHMMNEELHMPREFEKHRKIRNRLNGLMSFPYQTATGTESTCH